MRLCIIAAIAALTSTLVSADEAKDARAVVEAAYVRGVHASFSAEAMRKGFHPDFRMYTLRDGALSFVTRDEWIARLEKRAAEVSRKPQIQAEYPMVDVTGNTAVVRVELHRDGKHVFTTTCPSTASPTAGRSWPRCFTRGSLGLTPQGSQVESARSVTSDAER